VEQGKFFSGAAVVTFGGAYAVLAYLAQQAVGNYHWLTGGEMVHGLALAETTPGPLIMVVQFVAFLGAYHDPGSLDPWVAALLASLLTTWVTFVPSILFVLLGAPYVENLRANLGLSAALSGITAAIVGVIANLALYIALHTLFSESEQHTWGPVKTSLPTPGTVVWSAVVIMALGFMMIFRLRWSVLNTLGAFAPSPESPGRSVHPSPEYPDVRSGRFQPAVRPPKGVSLRRDGLIAKQALMST
jgi:chromate transporter